MDNRNDRNAVVLLSGGLDSATVLAMVQRDGYRVHAISFRYGQRHVEELQKAIALARSQKVDKHVIIDFDLRQFGGSALTSDIEVPTGRTINEMSASIPVTYVPARNTIFLSFALAYAESIDASDIFIGVNALDYSGYPDCRPEYISAYEKMANLATKAGVEGKSITRIHAPLISMTKREIIEMGLSLGVDYSKTSSCYNPTDGMACGQCDSCILRIDAFKMLGKSDPVEYLVFA